MKKENTNALLGGKVVSSFLKRHPEVYHSLIKFIHNFPCFKKPTEVLSWLQNGVKIKKCAVCGKRIDYQKGKRNESLFCSMNCRKTERGNEIWKSKIQTENPFTRTDVKEKIRQTNLKKYGVEHPSQSELIKEKQKKTMMEKYGVEHNSQLKSFKNNCLEKGYDKLCQNLEKNNLTMISPKETYHGIHQQNSKINIYELRCNKCNKTFEYKFNTSKNLREACPYCHPFYRSRGEEELTKFLSKYVSLITNDRKELSGYKNPELDIFIPNKHIAIEYNGLYWHSDNNGKDNHYHLNKTNECNKRGIRLIHIFEDEWINKQRIVKNRLKCILGLSSLSIGARKCEVRTVDKILTKKFIDKYHLQGHINSSVNLGLFYKNKLVALMTFGKSRFNKKYDWELLRYCTIGDFSIVGGASKLYKEFKRRYKGSVITYADKRWSNGNLYRQMGFDEITDSNIAYYYVKDGVRHSRVKFQKHKLENILEKFDKELSESENMRINGYHKVYDCGNKVFVDVRKIKNYK